MAARDPGWVNFPGKTPPEFCNHCETRLVQVNGVIICPPCDHLLQWPKAPGMTA